MIVKDKEDQFKGTLDEAVLHEVHDSIKPKAANSTEAATADEDGPMKHKHKLGGKTKPPTFV